MMDHFQSTWVVPETPTQSKIDLLWEYYFNFGKSEDHLGPVFNFVFNLN